MSEERVAYLFDYFMHNGNLYSVLLFLPIPILAFLLMRSSCKEKKVLLQMLFLTAAVSLGQMLGLVGRMARAGGYAYQEIIPAMIAYRVVVQSILILIVWLRLRKRAAALILFLVLFLPGIFAGIWPTFAVTVGIYYLCVRSLIKNKYPDSGKPLLLIILTVLAMSVAVEREYRQNFKINENLGYACLAIAREHFSEELYADAIPYFAEALERCPQWLEDMYLAEYAIALAETGDSVHAEEIMEKALEKGLNEHEEYVFLLQGYLAFANGEYQSASENIEDLVRIYEGYLTVDSDPFLEDYAFLLYGQAKQRLGACTEEEAQETLRELFDLEKYQRNNQ